MKNFQSIRSDDSYGERADGKKPNQSLLENETTEIVLNEIE